jgi:DNA mismatch repair ATPase MutS
MKAFLMYRDRDFDLHGTLPPSAEALIQDLELDTLFDAMASGDAFLLEVAKQGALASLDDPASIIYRQQVLRDCLEHPEIIRELYDLSVGALEEVRRIFFWRGKRPASLLSSSVSALQLFVKTLKRVRSIADDHAAEFRSEGFSAFFTMLTRELDDDYFEEIEDHLERLRFRDGVLISARLGTGNTGAGYVLRRPAVDAKQSWIRRLSIGRRSAFSFQIADRDEAGFRALEDLRARGISLVANSLSQSADHIISFLRMLQTELAFYLGCINVHTRLTQKGEPTCFPVPVGSGECALTARDLYDGCLSLLQDGRVVGNDVDADNKSLVMITGANRGGKSTFLRSVGLAQLMMQCGMFVTAASFRANVGDGLFTHFKREEDVTMKSGKLDEELSRMSDIADTISPNSIILFNESFAATNEREGSELARQVIRALLQSRVKVLFVTHLYDLAQSLHAEKMKSALFLRAERRADGQRTFRVIQGEPLPTSYGEDLYRRVFEGEPQAMPMVVSG